LDPLAVAACVLTAIYLAALVMHHGLLGRVILQVSILLQVIGAIGVAGLETRLAGDSWRRRGVFASVVIVVASAAAFQWTVGAAFKLAFHGAGTRVERLSFLHDHLGPGDVVLAKARRGWFIPMTGAKVVVPRTALAFIPDLEQRSRKVRSFFRARTSPEERLEIIRRWRVTHVMMWTDRAFKHRRVINDLGDRLEMVEKRGSLMLFRVVDSESEN